MFDFEKLSVYTKAKYFYSEVASFLKETSLDTVVKNQLKRSSLSIVLNIAEGSGRSSKADKRNFFVISRGSVFECVAIFDILKDEKIISSNQFDNYRSMAEEISKMLYSMTKTLEKG